MNLRWGIPGTGNIARQFAQGIVHSRRGILAAVSSRLLSSGEDFASACHGPRAYGSYQGVLADTEIDAVYVALPSTMHHEWSIIAGIDG